MDSIILILILVIIFLVFINIEPIRNTLYNDADANYQYNLDLENQVNENKGKTVNNISIIGTNKDNNNIFKHQDNFYMLKNNDGTLVEVNIESSDINYYEYPLKILTDMNNMKLKVNLTYKDYNYVGVLNNNYYHQEYILYEKPYIVEDTELENKLYEYVLIKIIDGVYTVMYELPPRSKILPKEYIWASHGPFQIGPLIFN